MARTIQERADLIPALAETFRTHGYEGATLAIISEATGCGKGSLYHFFPGGKEEMAAAVLAEINGWFEAQVFSPLRRDGASGIAAMFRSVDAYFRSGGRVCVVGTFALSSTRDRFGVAINGYFRDWTSALEEALITRGHSTALARSLAEEVVAGIQGALVLARAVDDPAVFTRSLARLEVQCGKEAVGIDE